MDTPGYEQEVSRGELTSALTTVLKEPAGEAETLNHARWLPYRLRAYSGMLEDGT